MKERLKKIARIAAYPLVYLVAFVLFALMTFPFDRLRDRVVIGFNEEQRKTGGQQELFIESMSGYWLTGVTAKAVRVVAASSDPAQPPSELVLDEARARLSILPLLVGRQTVTFSIKSFGGTVEGEFTISGKDRSVDVELKDIDIGKVSPIADVVGLPMEGKLGGTVRLSMPDGKAAKGTGTVAFDIRDVAIGDGKAKLRGALALPRLSVGTVVFSADAKEGVIKLNKFGATGRDLDLQGDGRIQMRELATESQCDMNLRFKFNDSYRNKSEITKTLFGAPGSSIPPLFEMDPKIKSAKRPDGFYGFHLRGKLSKLEIEPGGGVVRP